MPSYTATLSLTHYRVPLDHWHVALPAVSPYQWSRGTPQYIRGADTAASIYCLLNVCLRCSLKWQIKDLMLWLTMWSGQRRLLLRRVKIFVWWLILDCMVANKGFNVAWDYPREKFEWVDLQGRFWRIKLIMRLSGILSCRTLQMKGFSTKWCASLETLYWGRGLGGY